MEALDQPGDLLAVPGLGGYAVRETANAKCLYLPELPEPLYRHALEVLATEAAPAAQAAILTKLTGTYPVRDGYDWAVPAVGDVKTIALIARNVIAQGR